MREKFVYLANLVFRFLVTLAHLTSSLSRLSRQLRFLLCHVTDLLAGLGHDLFKGTGPAAKVASPLMREFAIKKPKNAPLCKENLGR
jgi:hypothetical protein